MSRTFLILVIPLLLTQLLFAQYAQLDTYKENQLSDIINELRDVSNIPGISIAIAQDRHMLYANGYGYADVASKTEMSTDDAMRTASVAKVMTATALGRLASLGKLQFDDKVSDHLPHIDGQLASLTIRQLASHTSGVEHNPVKNKHQKKNHERATDVLKLVKPKLKFEPGSDYSYSTFGFTVLAAIIESASGMSYANYMTTEIFAPLGMKNSYPEQINTPRKGEATIYHYDIDKTTYKLINKKSNGNYKLAGAGFRTTPSDLVKMMFAYHNGFIDSTIVGQLFEPTALDDASSTWTGIGWRTNRDVNNKLVYDHAGFWQGARSILSYYPDHKLSIAIMINTDVPYLIEQMAQVIAQIVLSPTSKPIEIANKKFTVEFTKENGSIEKGSAQLVNVNNKLNLNIDSSINSLKETTLYAIDENNYCIVFPSGFLNLKFDANHKVGNIYLISNRNFEAIEDRAPFMTIN